MSTRYEIETTANRTLIVYARSHGKAARRVWEMDLVPTRVRAIPLEHATVSCVEGNVFAREQGSGVRRKP